MYAHKQLTAKL